MSSAFIKEKIKDKPVNKKKLFVKFITTLLLAVVFGIVAAVCFYYTMRGMETVRGEVKPYQISLSSEEESVSSAEAVSEDDITDTKEEDEKREEPREKNSEPARTVINNITNKIINDC